MRKHLFLGLILVLALLVRVYRLESVPASLFGDEIDLGYQAKSLLETGRDYRGNVSPFYVRSFNADRTPLPAYIAVLTTAIFEQPELEVRMASVLLGLLIVGLGYALITGWTGSRLAGGIGAVVLALSPWQIQFSRIGFEAAAVGAVYLLAQVAFGNWLKRKNLSWLYLATFLLALSVYTYRTMTLLAPLTFAAWGVIYFGELWSLPLRHKLGLLVLAGVVMGAFVYATTIGAPDQTRINQISIFADKEVPIWVQRNREVDSGDLVDATVGKSAVWWSKVFHNKLVSWWVAMKNNYLESFSGQFLFITGDPNLRHSTGKGMLLTIDVIGLVLGGYWVLGKLKDKRYRWLVVWLLLAPIPSALTKDGGGGHHASRLFVMSLPLLLVVGLGWWRVTEFLKKSPGGLLVLLVLVAAYLGNFGFYYHEYLTHYRLDSAKFFGYGYKQALLAIKEEVANSDYEAIWLSESLDPPLPHVWLWNQIPPREVQKNGLKYGGTIGGVQVQAINWAGAVDEAGSWDEIVKPRQLYLLTGNDLPQEWRERNIIPEGIRLITTIKYPDNVPVLYLITRDELVGRTN